MTTISGTQGSWGVDLIINEVSTDPINNTSVINWEIRLKRLSGTSWIGGDPYITVTIAGKDAFKGSAPAYFDPVTTSGVSVKSGTLTGIEHNDNGTIKNNNASFSWTGSGFTPNNISASGTFDAQVIQRRSIVGATRTVIGEQASVVVTRYVDKLTHKIAYSIGSESGYVRRDGTLSDTEDIMGNLNIIMPVPSRWYSFVSSLAADCTLTITTYDGTLPIGEPYSTTFKVVVDPTDSKPVITSSVYDTNDSTYNLTGSRTTLVKNASSARVTWSVSPQNGATIVSTTLNGTPITTSPTTIVPTSSTIRIDAIDSRGLTASNSPSFTFKNYDKPVVSCVAERVAPTSNNIYVTFNGSWWNNDFGAITNTLYIQWTYKENGSSSSWLTGGILTPGTDYQQTGGNSFWSGTGSSASAIQIGSNLLTYDKEWLVAIEVHDSLNTISARVTIPVGIPIINWGEDFFNVNGDIRHNNVSILTTNETGVIRLIPSTTQTLQTDVRTQINTNTVSYNTSNKLSLSGNTVVIGSGITHVIVNCRWTAWDVGNYARYIYIYKNNNQVTFDCSYYDATMEATATIPVTQGDSISMYAYQSRGSSLTTAITGEQTYLEVAILY